jgi:hypothetical protein
MGSPAAASEPFTEEETGVDGRCRPEGGGLTALGLTRMDRSFGLAWGRGPVAIVHIRVGVNSSELTRRWGW